MSYETVEMNGVKVRSISGKDDYGFQMISCSNDIQMKTKFLSQAQYKELTSSIVVNVIVRRRGKTNYFLKVA